MQCPPNVNLPIARGLSSVVIALGIIGSSGAIAAEADPTTTTAHNPEITIESLEDAWEQEFEGHFERELGTSVHTPGTISATLRRAEAQTRRKTVVVYGLPTAQGLELRLVTIDGLALEVAIPDAHTDAIEETIYQFRTQLTNAAERQLGSSRYRQPAQQLYRWIIAPLENELAAIDPEIVIFCLGPGLRTVPLAALHNGEQFLIEKFAIAQLPSFSLFDTRYRSLKNSRVLAMGASEFDALNALPAVPVEVDSILGDDTGQDDRVDNWEGEGFLNEYFNEENLRAQHQTGDFNIIHFATHAEFLPGKPEESYIQMWQQQLRLSDVDDFNWHEPAIDLLVLSACTTALGDHQVELGFAGLTIHAGVHSAVASLWKVSDRGTLALMNEFYRQLRQAPSRAEALQAAQIALLKRQLLIDGDRIIQQTDADAQGDRTIPLPTELHISGQDHFDHPYYWAAFSMIGNPW